jgi:hypothetical protein
VEGNLPDKKQVVMSMAVPDLWPHRNALEEAYLASHSISEALSRTQDSALREGIICRTDNWRQVFATFFNRPESVRESLQRLYPIRLDTMHARLITQDDELYLHVEVMRLFKGSKRNQ